MLKLKRISVKNFKSFSNIDVYLRDLNLIIGANAGGKSNFIQILKFYSDAINYVLENAISLQGGSQYIRNNKLKENNTSEFIFEFNFSKKVYRRNSNLKNIIKIKSLSNQFILNFNKRGDGFSVLSEVITINFEEFANENNEGFTEQKIKEFSVNLERSKNKKSIKTKFIGVEDKEYLIEELIPPIEIIESLLNKDELMVKYLILLIGIRGFLSQSFAVFDFDPKVLKKSSSVSAKYNLEEDGSNLSICLNTVLKSQLNKRIFVDQLQDMLPFISGILTEKTLDKTMLFKIKEGYSNSKYIPASLMSDGTVNIVAMILALYFDDRDFIVFEEPERNIHPGLLDKLLNKFYEMNSKKQIIITTHNPEIIKHVKKDDIIFIKRNLHGFSEVKRIEELEHIQNFLDEEIGIDELYIDDILGGLF